MISTQTQYISPENTQKKVNALKQISWVKTNFMGKNKFHGYKFLKQIQTYFMLHFKNNVT